MCESTRIKLTNKLKILEIKLLVGNMTPGVHVGGAGVDEARGE